MIVKSLLPLYGAPNFDAVADKPFYHKRRFVISAPKTVKHIQNDPRVIDAYLGWTTISNILEIRSLVVSYGGIEAVKGIDLTVEQGKIVTLIGSNGAGKSTTLKTIAGLVKPKSGTITFNGEPLLGKSTDQIVSRGVTLVPEGRRVFPNLTVEENLRIGADLRKESIRDDLDRVYDLFPRLREREWQLAGTLSGSGSALAANEEVRAAYLGTSK